MRVNVTGRAAKVILAMCLGLASRPAEATTATWVSTADGSVEAWANAANWSAAQYPGQDGAHQGAYLTNRAAGAVYQAVVDAPLPYTVGTVEIKNLGAGGEAWVIVTNTVFAATNLIVRTGGRMRIDSGGVVTNLLGLTLDGTNGQLLVHSGGSLFAATNVFIGSSGNGKSNVLSLGDNAVFAVTNGYLYLGSGAGSDANRLLVAGDNVQMRSTATSVIGVGAAHNMALFTGTNVIWDAGRTVQMRVGQGATARSNTLMVSQGSLALTSSTLNIGLTAGSCFNALIVTNGARLFTLATVGAGYTTSNNLILVTGAGSRWDGNGAVEKSGDTGYYSGNLIIVDDHGTVSNACVYVGSGGALPFGNGLILTNGAQWWVGSGTESRIGDGNTNNWAVVTGSGTLWDMGAKALTVGAGLTAFGNNLRIENNGLVTNVNGLTVGGSGGRGNSLTVTKGGRCFLLSGGTFSAGSAGSDNFVLVTGAGAVLGNAGNLANGNFYVGNTAATNNVTVVDNGATCPGWNQLYVGRLGYSVGNSLLVTNGGYVQASLARVSHQGSNTWNNVLQVMDGGILEVGQNGLQVNQAATGLVGNNCITNKGGVYQFVYVAPFILPDPANNSLIYLTDGTIAFRAVSGVNVKGNWSGTLTNITFTGSNAFRLNAATNAASPDQSYTFADNLGPTNYARLELFNGSQYRGGSVTVGSGGTLALSGSPSAITNLTIASGGALEVTVSGTNSASRLNAVGSVALGGTLRLVLTDAPPPAGFDWTLINKTSAGGLSGQFDGDATVTQAYQGTNYLFRIDTAGGDGNDLVLRSLGRFQPGTVIMVL